MAVVELTLVFYKILMFCCSFPVRTTKLEEEEQHQETGSRFPMQIFGGPELLRLAIRMAFLVDVFYGHNGRGGWGSAKNAKSLSPSLSCSGRWGQTRQDSESLLLRVDPQ